ncbi:MAG: hypothetical protein SFW66_07455 [Gammaproteobacteria bacterium]|nr:hypothetical protein [Gammaproteobacteria bacterium]
MNDHLSKETELETVRSTLKEIAAQSYHLSMGLQGVVPAQSGGPSPAVRYLLEISLHLNKVSQNIDESGIVHFSEDDKHSGST